MNGFPKIPDIAGLKTSATGSLISFGGATLINAVFGKKWGIVNQYGVPILLSDSVISISSEGSQETSKDAIENGKVMTYNKVNNPRRCSVVLAKATGGSLGRGAWLAQINLLANSTLNFHIITPEYVYMNMQIVGDSISRTASDGLQLLQVKLDFEECKIATVEYSQEEVKNPQDSKTVDSGKVQAEDDSSVFKKIGDGVLSGIARVLGN